MTRFGSCVAAMALALTACSDGAESVAQGNGPFDAAMPPLVGPQQASAMQGGNPQQAAVTQVGGQRQAGPAQGGDAQQALQGLLSIRQQQCNSGNSLACQSLAEFPRHSQQLAQSGQACQRGDQQACGAYRTMSQRIVTAYTESAQVMQAGAQGAAQMNDWRNQMNGNHAGNMARLGAQAQAGQAAHEARQGAYAAQNQTWANGQRAGELNTGRFNDMIYEGTTVDAAGTQTFVPYGSTGYTDGYGNVTTGVEGGEAPTGWQEMTPTYAPE